MESLKKLIGVCVIFWGIAASSACPKASVTVDVEPEQAVVNMPEIKIYLTGEQTGELDILQIAAASEEETYQPMSLESFAKLDEGIHYYLLLDISNSIKTEEFQLLKDEVLFRAKHLGEKDTLSFLTFGDEVTLFWENKEGMDILEQRLASLQNDNGNTVLFEALAQTADLCLRQNDMTRNVGIVLTDGMDDIRGKTTKEESLKKLETARLPVYGAVVGEDNKEGVGLFGELVRETGGELYLVQQDNIHTKLQEAYDRIKNAMVLYLRASDNLVSGQEQNILLQFGQWNVRKEIKTGFYQWIPDNVSPTIEEVRQIGANQLEVRFSEPVAGASENGNYMLTRAKEFKIVPQGSSQEDGNTVILTFENSFYEGNYVLECRNIADISMEKNMVENAFEISLAGEKESKMKELLKNWGWLAVICGLLLFILILLMIYRGIKRRKGLVVVDEKLTLVTNVEQDIKQVVNIQERKGVHIFITMSSGKSEPIQMERDLFDSVIVGRADICDLSVEDKRLSKQHFVVEYTDECLFVTDLESTNGTSINGVKIKKRQKLSNGDIVTAGNSEFCFRWEGQINNT